jgi:radical SAM-linked protein
MARPVPEGPPPAPIVQRLTIRYAKRGRMRFASHRDVARAIERGVRKSGVPVAYSAGFSPHPKISYSGGAPTGSASEAEYLELSVTRRCEPADIGRRLDAALPDGIDVVEVVEAGAKSAALALEASEWEVVWPGVTPAAAQSAVQALLDAPSAEVERLTSKGVRRLDARAALVSLRVAPDSVTGDRRAGTDAAAGCAILRMVVRQMTPAVRPDDVLAALRQSSQASGSSHAPVLEPSAPALVTRLWQGPLSGVVAAQTGITVGIEAAGQVRFRSSGTATTPVRMAQPTAFPAPAVVAPSPGPHDAGPRRPEDLGPGQYGPQSRPELHRPGRTSDNAMLPDAESAGPAPAAGERADEQLPRGTHGQFAGQRAREPYGRDCPNARNGATEFTAGSP